MLIDDAWKEPKAVSMYAAQRQGVALMGEI